MDLKTFVSETITQIMQGVVDAQETAAESGGVVNPRAVHNQPSRTSGPVLKPEQQVTKPGKTTYKTVTNQISFSVAVTVSEGASSLASGGLTVASLMNLGGSKQSDVSSEFISRVEFSIPVSLPTLQN